MRTRCRWKGERIRGRRWRIGQLARKLWNLVGRRDKASTRDNERGRVLMSLDKRKMNFAWLITALDGRKQMRRKCHLHFLHLARKEEWRETQGIARVKNWVMWYKRTSWVKWTSKEREEVVTDREDVLTEIYQTLPGHDNLEKRETGRKQWEGWFLYYTEY